MAKRSPQPELVRSVSGTLHGQLYEELRSRILSGEYAPGEKIPTEAQLIELYSVSRMTVRRAVDDLRRDGLVDRKPALGTFVRERELDAKIPGVHSLTDEILQLGLTPGSLLLSRSVIGANSEIAEQLSISAGDPVLRLDRVRTADGRPFYVAESYVNVTRFPELEHQDYAAPNLSLLETYRRVIGLRVDRMTQLLSATGAPQIVAEAFLIKQGSPVLRFERTVYLGGRLPVEHVKAYFRGDTYKFYSDLSS